jgi:hypothetical protein
MSGVVWGKAQPSHDGEDRDSIFLWGNRAHSTVRKQLSYPKDQCLTTPSQEYRRWRNILKKSTSVQLANDPLLQHTQDQKNEEKEMRGKDT